MTKEKSKQKRSLLRPLGFALIVTILVYGYVFYPWIESDCYDFHVWECNECHKLNKTFLYCSGWCIDERSQGGCGINPEEKCEDAIPHGCVIPHYYSKAEEWGWI